MSWTAASDGDVTCVFAGRYRAAQSNVSSGQTRVRQPSVRMLLLLLVLMGQSLPCLLARAAVPSPKCVLPRVHLRWAGRAVRAAAAGGGLLSIVNKLATAEARNGNGLVFYAEAHLRVGSSSDFRLHPDSFAPGVSGMVLTRWEAVARRHAAVLVLR